MTLQNALECATGFFFFYNFSHNTLKIGKITFTVKNKSVSGKSLPAKTATMVKQCTERKKSACRRAPARTLALFYFYSCVHVLAAISHLTGDLPFQIIDTKEFLQKVDKINETYSPLPDAACFAVCDVASLYPNVNNEMGVPATETNKTKNS